MPHLLSIRNDRNRKAQINDRAIKVISKRHLEQ